MKVTNDLAESLRVSQVPWNLKRVTDLTILKGLESEGYIKVEDDLGSVTDLSGSMRREVEHNGKRYLIAYQAMAVTQRVFDISK
jgi:hypothetical protein